MTQHTPGPWEYDKELTRRDGETTYHSLFDSFGMLVAEVPVSDDGSASGQGWNSRESEQANARLIANAPTMLAALQYALADLEGILPEVDPDGDSHPGWTTIEEIRAAIATTSADD
jgi:hypothetical protein